MRQLLMSALTAAALFCLSACTTSGLMTPPEPVGDPGPQTATTKQGAPPALDSPDQTSLAAEESRNIGTQKTQFPQEATTAGSDPQAMPPQPTGPRSPMLGSPGGVSATQKSIYQASGQPQAPGVLGTLPADASSAGGGSIRFLPIIGAPIAAVTPLSRELATNAAARGISIKPSSDNSAEHMLKGYFSAFDDGGGTTITYVWDVLDASGARLTRLQGQEKLAGKSADPWANVPPNVMSKIASDTINMYLSWKSSRRG